MSALTRGRLAKATGTKIETIRFYEKIGLLAVPERTSSNYRAYRQCDLERLSFIRRARDLGFSLDQVRSLLDLADDRTRSCCAVDEITREQLKSVEQKISDLLALKRELSHLIEQCSQDSIADCRIIAALAPQPLD